MGLIKVHFISDVLNYGGMEASDVKRLKELEDENRKLKDMFKISVVFAYGAAGLSRRMGYLEAA
ncbi:hypothetical protein [Pseudoalteromonas luteoviolacea]|uniref:Transposase n=1 Tax=Pseudoalteromonas luteoviolacea (strain 2ta16) TaxID=1353533 RepID=V4HWN5_PSEL2|nr:hypothetical protein PL2TA16_04821 [Pseudoalteromonas luteoviolacea 2ta16]KZN40610.1 hypothetical protein N483_17310 [Pseudoalteromonas luteoviolacea NCIMB 1944]